MTIPIYAAIYIIVCVDTKQATIFKKPALDIQEHATNIPHQYTVNSDVNIRDVSTCASCTQQLFVTEISIIIFVM